MVKEIHLMIHPLNPRRKMYFQRSKEPSQGKEETGTDLIKCINQVHSRKEPEQNLTARGAAEAILGTQRSPSLLEQVQTPEAMNP